MLFDSEGVPKHLAGTRQSLPRRHVVGVTRHNPRPHPGNAPSLSASSSSSSAAVADAPSETQSEASTDSQQFSSTTTSNNTNTSSTSSNSGSQPTPFADGAAVCAMHPSYGRDVMGGGDAYWDAEVFIKKKGFGKIHNST